MDYKQIPWSIEDTIDNLEFLKKSIQAKVIEINLDGCKERLQILPSLWAEIRLE